MLMFRMVLFFYIVAQFSPYKQKTRLVDERVLFVVAELIVYGGVPEVFLW